MWPVPLAPYVLLPPSASSKSSMIGSSAEALKQDSGKAMLSRIDKGFLEDIAQVLEFGSRKYAWNNWKKGFHYHRLLDAALRHIHAFAEGEDVDPETGYSHIAHAACCLMFLDWHIKHRPDLDDRLPNTNYLPDAPHSASTASKEKED